jgi:hypothetical protein
MHTYITYTTREHNKNDPENVKNNPAATNMTTNISSIQPRAIEQPKTAADHNINVLIFGTL